MSNSQRVRRFLVILSALLFPVTMNYFSPAVPFFGGAMGILTGSELTFAALFVGALVFGRAWCGWLCPGAGLADILVTVNDRPVTSRVAKSTKYVIWAVWLTAVALTVVLVGGGFSSVDPFFATENGISIHDAGLYATYYVVLALIVVPSLLIGRRGFCHTLCWMAPFMVLGRKLANALGLRALRLVADESACNACGRCAKTCPMSLPVDDMIKTGRMERADCILCGTCVDRCPRNALRLRFVKPRAGGAEQSRSNGHA